VIHRVRTAGTLLLVSAIVAGCGETRPTKIEKHYIGRLPPNLIRGMLEFADDGKTYAVIVKDTAGQHVVVGGRAEPSHEGCTLMQFAPGSPQLFYWEGDTVGGRRQIGIVAAGRTIPTPGLHPERIAFSADGTRWATMARLRRDDGAVGPVVVIADGRELGRYEDTSGPVFSPDGRHLAYLAAAEGKVKLVVDGQERPPYESPQGGCLSASATANDGWTIRKLFNLKYLSDGRLLVVAQDREGWGVYLDGSRLASYPSVTPATDSGIVVDLAAECTVSPSIIATSLTAAEKAPVALWWERLRGAEERWRVVKNGKPIDEMICSKHTDPDAPEVSPDGHHYAYSCFSTERGKEAQRRLVVDGRPYGPYPDVCNMTFSADATRIAYAVSDGTAQQPWSIHVDRNPVTRKYRAVWRPRFTKDGKHIAWEAKRHEHAPGGVLGLDGREITSFDDVIWGPEFPRAGAVSWVIRRGRKLVRLDVPLG